MSIPGNNQFGVHLRFQKVAGMSGCPAGFEDPDKIVIPTQLEEALSADQKEQFRSWMKKCNVVASNQFGGCSMFTCCILSAGFSLFFGCCRPGGSEVFQQKMQELENELNNMLESLEMRGGFVTFVNKVGKDDYQVSFLKIAIGKKAIEKFDKDPRIAFGSGTCLSQCDCCWAGQRF